MSYKAREDFTFLVMNFHSANSVCIYWYIQIYSVDINKKRSHVSVLRRKLQPLWWHSMMTRTLNVTFAFSYYFYALSKIFAILVHDQTIVMRTGVIPRVSFEIQEGFGWRHHLERFINRESKVTQRLLRFCIATRLRLAIKFRATFSTNQK